VSTFADDEIAIERMLAEPRYAILEMLARPGRRLKDDFS
jgi:hypothetical protein